MSTGSVVVIGVFDGVHKGHQLLLNRAKEIADGRSIIALTFDPHPMQVFAPDRAPTMLTTLADRVELLKIHNADQVAVLKFNEKFAAMAPEDFVKDVLVGQLSVSTVIVGKNFTYGHKAAGNIDSLIKDGSNFNFTVDVQDLKSEESDVISSSRIRKLVVEGRSQEEVCNSTSQACQRWTELARKCEENMRQREAGYTGRLHPYCGEMEAFREEVTGVPLSSSPGAYDF